MPDKPLLNLKRLRAAASQAGTARQSPLYRWLRDNHREFARMLAEVGPRPNWPALAAELAALGLTDATGASPTTKVARQTWWKVSRAMAEAEAKAAKPRRPKNGLGPLTILPEAELATAEAQPRGAVPAAPPPPPAPTEAVFATGDPAVDRALNRTGKLKPLPPMGNMDTHGRRSAKPTKGKQDDGEG